MYMVEVRVPCGAITLALMQDMQAVRRAGASRLISTLAASTVLPIKASPDCWCERCWRMQCKAPGIDVCLSRKASFLSNGFDGGRPQLSCCDVWKIDRCLLQCHGRFTYVGISSDVRCSDHGCRLTWDGVRYARSSIGGLIFPAQQSSFQAIAAVANSELVAVMASEDTTTIHCLSGIVLVHVIVLPVIHEPAKGIWNYIDTIHTSCIRAGRAIGSLAR
nr:hypothetical protein CFP56_22547 [Quercus suber]